MHVQEVPHEVVQTTKCYRVYLRKNATLLPSSLLIVTTLPVLYCNSRGCNRKLLRIVVSYCKGKKELMCQPHMTMLSYPLRLHLS